MHRLKSIVGATDGRLIDAQYKQEQELTEGNLVEDGLLILGIYSSCHV